MDFARGTVKKYSREYTRTLKNGKKKKYKTEQVQVTVPKAENIFEDKEDVIIISKDQFDEIEDIDEILTALQLFNTILTEDNQILNENNQVLTDKLNENEEMIKDFNNQIEELNSEDLANELKEELNSKDLLINDLQEKVDCFKDEIESKELLISDLKKDLDDLNKKLQDLPEESEITFDFSNDDYVKLQKDFIMLSKKFEIIQEELFDAKVSALYHKNLADKCKRFILKLE